MKATAICRLLGVLAVLALWVGVSSAVEGSAPSVAPGPVTHGADGTSPTPPPLPMKTFFGPVGPAPTTYLADGTAPTPPPLPMKASQAPAEPASTIYWADGTAPTPPPLPMKGVVA
jgi:hypothetical protein